MSIELPIGANIDTEIAAAAIEESKATTAVLQALAPLGYLQRERVLRAAALLVEADAATPGLFQSIFVARYCENLCKTPDEPAKALASVRF